MFEIALFNNTVFVLIDNGKSPLKWIIDITIGYPDHHVLDRMTLVTGLHPPQQTVLHYRVFPVSEVPTDTEGLIKWMNDRYQEKDQLLNEFYRTGHFPEPSKYSTRATSLKTKKKTVLEFNISMALTVHGLFLLLSALPVYCMYSLYVGALL